MPKTRAEILATIAEGRSQMVVINGERHRFTKAEDVPSDAILSAGNPEAIEQAEKRLNDQQEALDKEREALREEKERIAAAEAEAANDFVILSDEEVAALPSKERKAYEKEFDKHLGS
jgi:ABC-type lipoprotein export system ATPase subunit